MAEEHEPVGLKATEPPPLTRTGLYARVWEEPLLTIATRYGISNVGLAKMCRRYEIPIPGRGYWQKLKAGKDVQRIPLKPYPGWTHGIDVELLTYRAPVVESSSPVPVAVAAQQAREQESANRIVVAPTVEVGKLHPLVKQTRSAFGKLRVEDTNLTVPKGEDVLDIRVTPALVERALLLMDALIKALEVRGYPVQSRRLRPVWQSRGGFRDVTWWPSRVPELMTCVQVGDQDVLLMLRERQKKIKLSPIPPEARRFAWDTGPAQELVGSGQLVLSIPHHVGGWGQWATWADTAQVKLEDHLNDIVVGVVAAAEEYRAVVIRWREQEQAEREVALRRLQWEQEKAAEAALAKELERQATTWALAKMIREYVAVARARQGTEDTSPIAPDGMDTASWLNWAQSYADRIDPLT